MISSQFCWEWFWLKDEFTFKVTLLQDYRKLQRVHKHSPTAALVQLSCSLLVQPAIKPNPLPPHSSPTLETHAGTLSTPHSSHSAQWKKEWNEESVEGKWAEREGEDFRRRKGCSQESVRLFQRKPEVAGEQSNGPMRDPLVTAIIWKLISLSIRLSIIIFIHPCNPPPLCPCFPISPRLNHCSSPSLFFLHPCHQIPCLSAD